MTSSHRLKFASCALNETRPRTPRPITAKHDQELVSSASHPGRLPSHCPNLGPGAGARVQTPDDSFDLDWPHDVSLVVCVVLSRAQARKTARQPAASSDVVRPPRHPRSPAYYASRSSIDRLTCLRTAHTRIHTATRRGLVGGTLAIIIRARQVRPQASKQLSAHPCKLSFPFASMAWSARHSLCRKCTNCGDCAFD